MQQRRGKQRLSLAFFAHLGCWGGRSAVASHAPKVVAPSDVGLSGGSRECFWSLTAARDWVAQGSDLTAASARRAIWLHWRAVTLFIRVSLVYHDLGDF